MSEMTTNEERRQRIIQVLSEVLERLCDRNDRFIEENNVITRFHALRPPSIAIKYYLQRIAKYSNCSEECFVFALIFIDRLIRTNENFLVNSLNVHRLIITTVMAAAKFFDDQYFNNSYYGKIGGVTCKEINLLEIEFLFMINFNLFVTAHEYKTYNERLMCRRGEESFVEDDGVKKPTTKHYKKPTPSQSSSSNTSNQRTAPYFPPAQNHNPTSSAQANPAQLHYTNDHQQLTR